MDEEFKERILPLTEKAIYIDRDFADIYYTRARMYRMRSKWDETIRDFSKVIELCPEDWDAYYQRGECYWVWEYTNQQKAKESEFKGYYMNALDDYQLSKKLLQTYLVKIQKGEPHFSCEYYDQYIYKQTLEDKVGITSRLIDEQISRLENLKKASMKGNETIKERREGGIGFFQK